MNAPARILGVDFTSAPRPAKPIVAAAGRCRGGTFELESIECCPDFAGFEALLARPGPWIGGFDFPFGLPREAVLALGWPGTWEALVRHCRALGRARFRALLDAYRESRPAGARYAHRHTDAAAGSHSPLKLVNPPVGLMFLEGAPRLLDAGVSLPGLRAGDPRRVAVEAYPGMLARRVTFRSYKADARAKQTAARRAERRAIAAALGRGGLVLGGRGRLPALRGPRALIASLVEDASGDRLDAVLAALQAAWCWLRRRRGHGIPPDTDPLEGWVAGAPRRYPDRTGRPAGEDR